MRTEIANNSSDHGKLVQLQPPSFSEIVEGSIPCVIVVIYFTNFSREMYMGELSDSDANIRDFETE